MSGEKNKAGLPPEEAALWARVTKSVTPLRERASAPPPPRPPKADKKPATSAPKKSPPRKHLAQASPAPVKATSGPPPRPHRAPPGGTLDRRTRQRMLRGKMEIEARLDLHGHGAEEAHAKLRAFLVHARMRGLRTVLVITGKGKAPVRHTLHGHDFWHAPERAGRLRALLPEWLGEAGIAEHVAGWTPAHPSQGGGGAFCIRLRRRER